MRTIWSAILLCSTLSAWAGVEVNTANEAELDSVRGLGPSSTARILSARENGQFVNWADFMRRVKGIKPATAHKLSQQGLTVNSAPYDAAAPGAKVP
jgi:competence protein ComEA